MPAVAHAIEELDELLAALPEHRGLSTGLLPDEVLRRVEAPQLGDRLPLGVDDLLLCLLYTSPSPRDCRLSRMPSSA